MELERIEALAQQMTRDGTVEAVLDDGARRVTLRRMATTSPAAHATEPQVRAPWFGRFRRVHPTRPAPEAAPGDHVAPGDLVGYVEIDGRLHAVRAETAGRLAEFMVEDGQIVGFGQPLARLD
jgi:biotin carboxyl carrier protein